jgi:hypothetical protein
MKSMSGGNFSPIPKAMLYLLAKMTLEEDEVASGNTPTSGQRTEGHNNHNSNNRDNETPKQQPTELAGLLSKASQKQ